MPRLTGHKKEDDTGMKVDFASSCRLLFHVMRETMFCCLWLILFEWWWLKQRRKTNLQTNYQADVQSNQEVALECLSRRRGQEWWWPLRDTSFLHSLFLLSKWFLQTCMRAHSMVFVFSFHFLSYSLNEHLRQACDFHEKRKKIPWERMSEYFKLIRGGDRK